MSAKQLGTRQAATETAVQKRHDPHLHQIWGWNQTVPANIDRCIHTQIVENAKRHPERPAVISWDGELTYGQLDEYSASLATYVLEHSGGPGTTVPICFNKSIWAIVSLLGVLRSGSTVTMTDPSQPEQRLRVIVDEVAAKLVLTSTSCQELGRVFAPEATVVAVNQEFFDRVAAQSSRSLPVVPPSQTMYIIFTSGSTGKPKGVMISHANYSSGAVPRAAAVGYRPHSRVLDFPSYAFDVSYDCMLCTLANQGCICVPSDDQRINDLSGAIRSMDVNMAHMTPSVARLLDGDIVPSLEVLGVGGEALSIRDTASWTATTKVVNAYGPSECTVGCTINNQISPTTTYITIGKGCGGCTWICEPDDHDVLTPWGEVGELLIEGPIVGQGYVGNPEKTHEVFLEDPAWLTAGFGEFRGRRGRLYKTGDLVKYDENGALIFIGRKDQQVKIRGQRVELGEIEHHLRHRLPAGFSVAAEVIKPGQAEPVLVAFLADSTSTSADLKFTATTLDSNLTAHLRTARQNLEENLPSYMIPMAYISLNVMPLLVSLKVDRKRLRQIGEQMSRRELSNFNIKNATKKTAGADVEVKLRSIWASVLDFDAENETADHFFALGGDSLKAMKLVSAAKDNGLSLSVAQVLQNPFLSDMAAVATTSNGSETSDVPRFSMLAKGLRVPAACSVVAEECNVPLEEIDDIYPCTPLQEGLMALSSKVAEAYISQRVVKLPDMEAAEKLERAFQTVEQHCEILRTRIIQITDHGLLQVVLKSGARWKHSHDLEQYLVEDREERMDLGKPLVRYAIVKSDNEKDVHFVLTMHHALYDGWSMPLIIDQVSKAYRLRILPPTPSFKSFIQYLHQLDKQSAEQYWRTSLESVNRVQFPHSPSTKHQAQSDSLLEHYIRWNRLSCNGTTLANIIRGAWAMVASDFNGSSDVVFGETLTGRAAPIHKIEQIQAPLITTVPFRVDVSRRLTTTEYLQNVHKHTIDRIPHEHFGLQNIRRLSRDARAACELRTGLVIHPYEQRASAPTETSPANDLMPANDLEAAREALKFNSYNLMLVCTQDVDGFLTMASFDSRTVTVEQMKQALHRFEEAIHFLSHKDNILEDFKAYEADDLVKLKEFSSTGAADLCTAERHRLFRKRFDAPTATWIVHSDDPARLLPLGAVGELVLERGSNAPKVPELNETSAPAAINGEARTRHFYNSKYLARYQIDGTIVFVDSHDDGMETRTAAIPDYGQKPDGGQALSTTATNVLRQCWSRLLNVDEVDITEQDNFFELGADSITAMRLVSELRSRGYSLTVAEIFANDDFTLMANRLQATSPVNNQHQHYVPFSSLSKSLSIDSLQSLVRSRDDKIVDAYPARPLQSVAVEGTVKQPKFSVRYELFHFDGKVDPERLFDACRLLVESNEILRTTFVEINGIHIAVVFEQYPLVIDQIDTDEQVACFSARLCDLDARTRISLGSPFVKFFHVKESNIRSTLIMRISHAQYDEVCLPDMLGQLVAYYKKQAPTPAVPFSRYVNHIVKTGDEYPVAYWKSLLQGSAMTVLKPKLAITEKKHFAISKTVNIKSRPKSITVATLPTAAWALCLARKLSLDDVTFGEVVSGRNIGFENAEAVMGPCWQYIPVRVKFSPTWTSFDLLTHLQRQHAESGRYASMGLEEIAAKCTDWPSSTTWFDTVVHQDVAHAESLAFPTVSCRMETIYPQEEPLREWKVQAFHNGDDLTLEIVTFQSWRDEAVTLLDEVAQCLTDLVGRSDAVLLPQ